MRRLARKGEVPGFAVKLCAVLDQLGDVARPLLDQHLHGLHRDHRHAEGDQRDGDLLPAPIDRPEEAPRHVLRRHCVDPAPAAGSGA